MTRSLSRRQPWLPVIAFLAVSCGGGGGATKVPLAKAATDSNARAMEAAHSLLGPEAKAALDSGNALYRRKAYVQALAEYRLASDRAPQHAAPLFGIYMVARAMNNSALADSAIAGIRARNGPLPAVPAGQSGAPHSMSDSALKALQSQMKKGAKAG
jgi:hypothetical protein